MSLTQLNRFIDHFAATSPLAASIAPVLRAEAKAFVTGEPVEKVNTPPPGPTVTLQSVRSTKPSDFMKANGGLFPRKPAKATATRKRKAPSSKTTKIICGRTNKAGNPCRNPVAEEGMACYRHKSVKVPPPSSSSPPSDASSSSPPSDASSSSKPTKEKKDISDVKNTVMTSKQLFDILKSAQEEEDVAEEEESESDRDYSPSDSASDSDFGDISDGEVPSSQGSDEEKEEEEPETPSDDEEKPSEEVKEEPDSVTDSVEAHLASECPLLGSEEPEEVKPTKKGKKPSKSRRGGAARKAKIVPVRLSQRAEKEEEENSGSETDI